MPFSDSLTRTFEDFPDELLLTICEYLSSTDVLFSFYGLNSRLSRTIHSYTQHVVLAQTPYIQFQHLCTSILPNIGSNISSLVLSNQWIGVLSHIFLDYFADRISLVFPRLKHLSLISFSVSATNALLDSLQNLPELHQINLYFQYDATNDSPECQRLLHCLFTANNHHLHSIFFDNESVIFSLARFSSNDTYSNIKKLSIDIETIDDLHRLLTVLPQLVCLYVTTNEESSRSVEIRQSVPNENLKQLQVRSFGPSWHLEDLVGLLRRIPNVEELSMAIDSHDDRTLLDGEKIFTQLGNLPLKKFSYFLQFYDSSSVIDPNQIRSTWHQFNQEIVCFQSDQKGIFALFTLPFNYSYLLLDNSVARHELFITHCTSQVNILTLDQTSSNIVNIFPILKTSRRLQRLSLRIGQNVSPQITKQIQLNKLPYLNKVVVWPKSSVNIECFEQLLEVSPNLHHFEAKYEFISALIDNERLWPLFEHRITHLYVAVLSTVGMESVLSAIKRLPSIFPCLKHFYLKLDKDFPPADSIVLVVLKHVIEWKALVSLGVVDVAMTDVLNKEDIRQWVTENAMLHVDRSFHTGYFNNTFRLWF